MKSLRKFGVCFFALIIGLQMSVMAEIPNWTVVVGDKAYDINYVNDESHSNEFLQEITKENAAMYVKGYDGTWYDNSTGEIVEKSMIPSVIYKDVNGVVTTYEAGDGERVSLEVIHASFIDSKTLQVEFSESIEKESVFDKFNFKVGENKLLNKDSIEVKDDSRIILITLDEELTKEDKQTNITIEKNNEEMENIYDKNILVLNEDGSAYKSSNEFIGDVNVIAEKKRINNLKIDGDFYIYGDKATVYNSEIKGNVIIDCGEEGKTNLSKVTAEDITILSGGENSIYLTSIKAKKLNMNSSCLTRVKANGSSKIDNTTVITGAILESSNDSFGKVNISLKQDKTSEIVELRGIFKQPIIVETSAQIKAAKGAKIEQLEIAPTSKEAEIKLEGKFKEVKLSEDFNKLELGENTTIDCLDVESKAEVTGDSTSKIKKVEQDEDVEVVIDENINLDSSDNETNIPVGNTSTGSNSGSNTGSDSNDKPNQGNKIVKQYTFDNGIMIETTIEKQDKSSKNILWITVKTTSKEIINENATITIYNSDNELIYYGHAEMINGKFYFKIPLPKGAYKAKFNIPNVYDNIEIMIDIL